MKNWFAFLKLRHRILILLIALDHLALAVITLGNCKRGETISACAWTLEQDGKRLGKVLRPLIDWLLVWLERDHCRVSWLAEKHTYQGF